MSLYERLGLNRNADSQEIRKAYLKLSKTEHPDKGGDAEKFKTIQEAYEILSDDNSRVHYDQTGQIPGEQQHNHGGGGGHPFGFPFNMGNMGGFFGTMFGGGMNRQQMTKQQKGPPKIHEIGLTLSNFFYGKKFEIKFERQVFCSTCKGEGSDMFEMCNKCDGAGFREVHVMIGPGMAAVTRGPCDSCEGKGKRSAGVCSNCNGKKFLNQEKSLTVVIEPGMVPGDILNFPNECSDNHMFEQPGDVHIVLMEADEPSLSLTRNGETLNYSHKITLSEALLGSQFVINNHPAHQNGLTINVPPGTMRGDVIVIENEGMPCRGNTRRGNLNVSIQVEVTSKEKESLINNKAIISTLF